MWQSSKMHIQLQALSCIRVSSAIAIAYCTLQWLDYFSPNFVSLQLCSRYDIRTAPTTGPLWPVGQYLGTHPVQGSTRTFTRPGCLPMALYKLRMACSSVDRIMGSCQRFPSPILTICKLFFWNPADMQYCEVFRYPWYAWTACCIASTLLQ